MSGTHTDTSASVATGAQQIIERAAHQGITDIHIEPGLRFVLVRYRRAGVLYVANKLPSNLGVPLTKHFKKLAKLDVRQTAAPQVGNCQVKIGQRLYDVEVATLPVMQGEKLTIKLHEATAKAPKLTELGLWGASLSGVQNLLTKSRGLIIVAGTQPSKLSSSLTSLVHELESPIVKAAFVNTNDQPLPLNIKQVTVAQRTGQTADRQLTILASEHFDVIGINAVTDHKTAEAAATAAEHSLVLAGILASSSVRGIIQLERMRTNTAPTAVIGQLFVRRLCEHCRESYQIDAVASSSLDTLFQTNKPAVMKRLHELEVTARNAGLSGNQPLSSTPSAIQTLWRAKPHGCRSCDHTGYAGDIGTFEVCNPSGHLSKALTDHKPANDLEQLAIQDGMISLRVDALIKTLRGLVDLPTLLSVCSTTG